MFAEELAETITDSNMVELPPLRFVKETSKAEKVNMEAVVIDIDEQEIEDVEEVRRRLEGIDDLNTEADVEDISGGGGGEEGLPSDEEAEHRPRPSASSRARARSSSDISAYGVPQQEERQHRGPRRDEHGKTKRGCRAWSPCGLMRRLRRALHPTQPRSCGFSPRR